MIQRQIEADHGVTIQVVVVGDCPLDDPQRALLDAAREATVNAAKWSGASQVAIFAEVDASSVMIYVRDRGRGFDPTAVGDDRQGIAHSIRARVARVRRIARSSHSAPGEGTEVELSMPRRVSRPHEGRPGRARLPGRRPPMFRVGGPRRARRRRSSSSARPTKPTRRSSSSGSAFPTWCCSTCTFRAVAARPCSPG